MNRFKGSRPIMLGATLLIAVFAWSRPMLGVAAPPDKDVVVVNTPAQPVPVTGNTTVSGTVSIAGTPTVTVVNTPAQPVPVTGNTTVSGTVSIAGTPTVTVANSVKLDSSSTVNLGATDSSKLDTANAHLQHIDSAASLLSYDGSGNLKVSVAAGGGSDPTVANTSPFGFGSGLLISSHHGQVFSTVGSANVTAFSFYSDNDVEVRLYNQVGSGPDDVTTMLIMLVKGGSPGVVQSLSHAMPANVLGFYCLSGNDCTVNFSVIAY
jgi:hypothetical protein